MSGWMLTGPRYALDEALEAACAQALANGDAASLPPSLPRWAFLGWLTRQGYLLHGSSLATITRFEPRTPNDRSPDAFSKQTAVFAASDGL